MKKISKHIVIDARPIGSSTGRYLRKLVENLGRLDKENRYTILIWSTFSTQELVLPSNFQFKIADYPISGSFKEQFNLTFMLRKLKPDLVHFGMVQQPILYRGKSITTVHDLTTARFRNPAKNWLVFKIKQWVYRGLIVWVAHKSKNLIVPTQYVKTDLAKFAHINKDKIVVTYESAEEFSEPAEPILFFEGKQYIMFNGRPLPHKNLRRLIQTLGLLGQKYPNLYLMIAGKKDASFKSYVNLANELKVGDKVVLTDWITDGQLKWAMANTRAYIYPSLSEGFGLPPLEAMLHGAPVAASNTSCIPEVLGDAAQYFDPLSVEDMASKIDDVLSDDKLREELIKNGHEQVKKYSWEKMAAQTLEIYKTTLKT